MLTFNNISAISLSGLSTDGSLLRITLKFSFHLDRYSTSLCTVIPSLFFIGFEEFVVYCYIIQFLHVSSVCCQFSL